MTGLALAPVRMLSVDVAQHAAEKFHAVARDYPDGRQSSRVKDLVDLVLLVEAGLLPHNRLGPALARVYVARDGHPPPAPMPPPPSAWRSTFPAMATPLGLAANTLDEAVALLAAVYDEAITSSTIPSDQERLP